MAYGGDVCDILIIGGGPAGLSAAVNAKARNMTAILLESRDWAGKVRSHPETTNYLGFPGITGVELAQRFTEHCLTTGFPMKKEKALKIMPQDGWFITSTDKGLYESRAVILTIGVAQAGLLPGEEEFVGRGISYCVTCDGVLYRDKDVVVVGYIPEGEEEANALAGLARSVTYVVMYPNINFLKESVKVVRETPVAIVGDSQVRALKTDSGELKADGVFIIRETIPVGVLLEGLEINDKYIAVDRQMTTNIPGIYAAGDCTGSPFQVAKSVGEGQIAVLSASKYVNLRRGQG